jgi:hypothetical protein
MDQDIEHEDSDSDRKYEGDSKDKNKGPVNPFG